MSSRIVAGDANAHVVGAAATEAAAAEAAEEETEEGEESAAGRTARGHAATTPRHVHARSVVAAPEAANAAEDSVAAPSKGFVAAKVFRVASTGVSSVAPTLVVSVAPSPPFEVFGAQGAILSSVSSPILATPPGALGLTLTASSRIGAPSGVPKPLVG
jgi:hypothetical protein